jgi:hypothetical protein
MFLGQIRSRFSMSGLYPAAIGMNLVTTHRLFFMSLETTKLPVAEETLC